jgi:predicted phage terminase large subunit-like protein
LRSASSALGLALLVAGLTLGDLFGRGESAPKRAIARAVASFRPTVTGEQSPTELAESARRNLTPQPGPQATFLASEADIRIYGGSVYGGKTWALTRQPLDHVDNPGFNFVAFRRTTPEIRNPGGMWDEARKMYPQLGAEPRETTLDWFFPSGARGKMAGLQYESDVLAWKSAQICALIFDQLEEFTEQQFFYMLSRNRSTCGVRPYVLAACNPDPDSFLATFLAWWIDQESGYAIPERSGSVRFFIRVGDQVVWSSVVAPPDAHGATFRAYSDLAMAELDERHAGHGQFARSVTFVLARLQDNKIGVALDPGYEARIRAMSLVDQMRLLGGDRGGNWRIRAAAGLVFNSGWFGFVEPGDPLPKVKRRARAWDKAATAGAGDWTWGVRQAHLEDGTVLIEDCVFGQWAPGDRDQRILEAARLDGPEVPQVFEQEPGAAGVSDKVATVKLLAGFRVEFVPASGDKIVRAGPIASQAKVGLVKLVRNPVWNSTYLRLLHAFPTKGVPDDPVDATSLGYNRLAGAAERDLDPKHWRKAYA